MVNKRHNLTASLWSGRSNAVGSQGPGSTHAELIVVKGSLVPSEQHRCHIQFVWCLDAVVPVFWLVLNLQLCGVVATDAGPRRVTACVQILALSLPRGVTMDK